MSRPNSLATRVRQRLVAWLEPMPDVNEAWCVNCALNGGRTVIVPSRAARAHVEQHQQGGLGTHTVRLKTRATESDLM